MNRRDFSSMLAGTAASSLLPKSGPLQQTLDGVSQVSDPATHSLWTGSCRSPHCHETTDQITLIRLGVNPQPDSS